MIMRMEGWFARVERSGVSVCVLAVVATSAAICRVCDLCEPPVGVVPVVQLVYRGRPDGRRESPASAIGHDEL